MASWSVTWTDYKNKLGVRSSKYIGESEKTDYENGLCFHLFSLDKFTFRNLD